MSYQTFLALFAGAACLSASAAPATVQADDAWVRATVPQQRATGAFMRLTAEAPVRLLGASSPAAARVELHEMRMEGDLMRMRQVASIELAAGRTVVLAPGGYHIMLLGLARQARPGERIPLNLEFEGADRRRFSVEVAASVRALGAAQPAHP